jgi:small subunit ribosomal protein S4
MSRYRGPKLRITRRLGSLPGLTMKKSEKENSPGKPGKPKRGKRKIDEKENNDKGKKRTEYGLRLEEKQKLKFNYGLTESQLYRYIKEARRRQGVTGLILLQLLEMRLDSLCFALGFGKSIGNARQLVNHGHITVNQKVVSIASFQCHLGDIIGVKKKSISKNLIEANLKDKQTTNLPGHIKLNLPQLEGTISDYCDRNDVKVQLNELLVIEFYSRR